MARPRLRTAASWDALSASYRRRWRTAYGADARDAYLSGRRLTASQRGHRFTPQEPIDALRQPWKYPRYVATHERQLNELARRRGMAEHGLGDRGRGVTSWDQGAPGENYTWVVPDGTLSPSDFRLNKVFQTRQEAELWARRSGAPPGIVMVVDRGPGHVWRWEVWFGYPESRARGFKGAGHMRSPEETRADNVRAIRDFYDREA